VDAGTVDAPPVEAPAPAEAAAVDETVEEPA
jgi:hypothetical protein